VSVGCKPYVYYFIIKGVTEGPYNVMQETAVTAVLYVLLLCTLWGVFKGDKMLKNYGGTRSLLTCLKVEENFPSGTEILFL
jgi:hypothetical protein